MNNRNFLFLLAGQGISQIGDKFHMIALSLWVLDTTGSASKMGAVLAASLIPSLVLGFFSGAVIDRYSRKLIIVGTDVIRGMILCGFAVLFYLDALNFYMILFLQVLLSVNAAFFDPAIPSVIPQLVEKKDLAAANSRHQFINGVSTIAGAFMGGVFVSAFGYFWVFAVNGASFLLSAVFESFIQIPASSRPGNGQKEQGILADMTDGYRYILSRHVLMILIFMALVIHFFVGSIEVFMPVIANAITEEGARNLGFFQTALGLGTLLMAGILSVRPISGKEKTALFASVFFIGLLYTGAAFITGEPALRLILFLVLIFLFGASILSAGVAFKTLLQKNIEIHFSGRVFAVAGALGNASIPGAMIVYGFLLEKYAFETLLLGSGLVLMPISIVSFVLYKEETYGSSKIRSTPLA